MCQEETDHSIALDDCVRRNAFMLGWALAKDDAVARWDRAEPPVRVSRDDARQGVALVDEVAEGAAADAAYSVFITVRDVEGAPWL